MASGLLRILSEWVLPNGWYRILYYFLAGVVSLLTALAVTIILLLFTAVRQVLKELTPLENMWGGTGEGSN